MRQSRFAITASLAAWLLMAPVAASFAQYAPHTPDDYARAIYAAIYPHWANASYSPNLKPDSTCTASIVQMPGGDILSVEILPDCAFAKESQSALVAAVRRSAPLPYRSFESVYQREIHMTFHAASAGDRKADVADAVASQRKRDKQAEEDQQWDAKIQARIPYDKYVSACTGRLEELVDRMRFKRMTDVMVTVNKAGKVVAIDDTDKDVVAIFMAMPPCHPIPDDVATVAGTLKIGPIALPNWDPEPPSSRGTCHDASGKVCEGWENH